MSSRKSDVTAKTTKSAKSGKAWTDRSRSVRNTLVGMVAAPGANKSFASVSSPRTPGLQRASTPSQRGRATTAAASRGPRTAPGAPPNVSLERADQSRSRSPLLPDRGPNTCLWCGGAATFSSCGPSGSLDMCSEHFQFHSTAARGVPWKALCLTYHNSKDDQESLDKSCSHFTTTGHLPEDRTCNASVSQAEAASAEVYVKYSLLTRHKLES